MFCPYGKATKLEMFALIDPSKNDCSGENPIDGINSYDINCDLINNNNVTDIFNTKCIG